MLFHWKLVENITKCTLRTMGACLSSKQITPKILHAYDEIFLGKCGVERNSSTGFFTICSKYNRVDFCLNSKLTPHFITKMNSSKISCIQQIKKNKKIKIIIKKMYTIDEQQHVTRERSHSQILQKRALRIIYHKIIL